MGHAARSCKALHYADVLPHVPGAWTESLVKKNHSARLMHRGRDPMDLLRRDDERVENSEEELEPLSSADVKEEDADALEGISTGEAQDASDEEVADIAENGSVDVSSDKPPALKLATRPAASQPAKPTSPHAATSHASDAPQSNLPASSPSNSNQSHRKRSLADLCSATNSAKRYRIGLSRNVDPLHKKLHKLN